MKLKIILASLSLLLVISIGFNIYQNSSSNSLQLQYNSDLSSLENKYDDLNRDYLRALDDKRSLENRTSSLQSELNQIKQSQIRRQSQEKVEALYRALYPLEIRSQMSSGSAIIGDVPVGGKVEVLESFFGNTAGWKIKYNGIIGWVPTTVGDVWDSKDAFERVK